MIIYNVIYSIQVSILFKLLSPTPVLQPSKSKVTEKSLNDVPWQVRSEALGLLLRTHGAVKQSSYIPVEYMQEKMLYMESQEQVVNIANHNHILCHS